MLHDINLRVPAGTSLAIVGPTGSGKTTLVNLIPRIQDAEPGAVLIDGHPIREFPREVAAQHRISFPRKLFCSATQSAKILPSGKKMPKTTEIYAAADAANIAKDIESFPEQYRTVVGERGITLSGGQKQRTAIARAIIRNPSILILDDALSSVDTQTEDKILDHLRDDHAGAHDNLHLAPRLDRPQRRSHRRSACGHASWNWVLTKN